MKKFTAILLAVCLLVVAIPMYASAEASGTTGDCSWKIEGNVLTISGAGATEDFKSQKISEKNKTTAPWGTDFEEVVIEDDVTYIGDFAFIGCDKLKKVTMADSVLSTGTYLFQECSELTDVKLSANLTEINNCMFYKCSALKGVTIPGKVKKFGYAVFYQSGIESITLPDSVELLDQYLFYNCKSLKTVNFGKNLKTIAMCVFSECTALESMVIPDTVTSLGSSAFIRCANLKELTLGSGIDYIDMMICKECTSLETVIMSANVWYVDMQAFENAAAIKDVYYGGSSEGIYVEETGNEGFLAATWHYNYAPVAATKNIEVNVSTNATVHTTDATTVTLLKGASTVETKTISALSGKATFEDVADGEYTVLVERPYHAAYKATVTVNGETVSKTVELRLVGDNDGDGSIGSSDKDSLKDFITQKNKGEAYDIAVMDMNGDNKVNMVDFGMLKGLIK